MASYQSRDPLLDEGTTAMLERRGQELLGIGLLAVALLFALMMGSYSPSDPGWMMASDAPVSNTLGNFGAALSSTLVVILGMGVWSLPLILAAWGLRLVTHIGADRVFSRVFFSVFAVLAASLYATTLHPSAAWDAAHDFGLGGLLGDTLLGTLLGILPTNAAFGIKLLSVVTVGLTVALMGFVMGIDRAELRLLRNFLIGGLVGTYSTVVGAGLRSRFAAQRAVHSRHGQAAAPQVAAQDPSLQRPEHLRPEPLRAAPSRGFDAVHTDAARQGAPATGGDARVDFFFRKPNQSGLVAPENELIEPSLPSGIEVPPANEQRLRDRISDAVRNFATNPKPKPADTAQFLRSEPALLRGQTAPPQRKPLLADLSPPAASAVQPSVVQPSVVQPSVAYAPPMPDDGFDTAPGYTAPGYTAPDYTAPDYTDWADEDDDADINAMSQISPRAPILALQPDMRRGHDLRQSKVQAPVKKPVLPSRKAMAEAQPHLRFDDSAPVYELPPLSLLSSADTVKRYTLSHEALEENARMLESVLDDYGVKGEIVSVRPGPVVTMYELEPAPGLKASRVIGLADDIARSMSALSARVSTVPGRTVIGIELPNATREKVVLREIIAARDFGDSAMRLPLALGKDIGGDPIVANLAKMPHLLIAGTTGSGKSVAINTMILSLLYKLSPEECRLIMIDPKMLELSVYDGIPHLLSPVVTDPKKAVVALKWVVSEMEERYRKMSKMGVRNIEGYNGRVRDALGKGEMFRRTIQTGFDETTGEPVFETEEFQPIVLPYIVVVVDEMADLMMVAGKEIEACIQRLAQMARASGIHLIMATQRPSVDVITGTIKANFPTRISFQVTSKIDSRTILGEQGAEQLLGMGDMLFMAGGGRISRIHGPFVSDEEVEEIVNHLKSYGPPSYVSSVVETRDEGGSDVDAMLGLGGDASDDALYDQAVAIVAKDRKCSTSYIQRKLGIGYNKAARLVEQMEENMIVTTANHVGKREILLPEA
jgi:S-DNA-T family DNA segregation ATPase FtsK/SpoIIIE